MPVCIVQEVQLLVNARAEGEDLEYRYAHSHSPALIIPPQLLAGGGPSTVRPHPLSAPDKSPPTQCQSELVFVSICVLRRCYHGEQYISRGR